MILINKKDTECAIRNINSIVIDAEGYFYKCWEKISSPKHRFAQINQNGEVKLTDVEVLNSALNDSDPLEDSECSRCEYLPLCFGGCPMRRIEKSIDNCTSYKNNIRKWLIAYQSHSLQSALYIFRRQDFSGKVSSPSLHEGSHNIALFKMYLINRKVNHNNYLFLINLIEIDYTLL